MWVVKVRTKDNQHNRILKRYPFKLQCIIWCYLKGFVMSGYADFGPAFKITRLVYTPAADCTLTIEEEA